MYGIKCIDNGQIKTEREEKKQKVHPLFEQSGKKMMKKKVNTKTPQKLDKRQHFPFKT